MGQNEKQKKKCVLSAYIEGAGARGQEILPLLFVWKLTLLINLKQTDNQMDSFSSKSDLSDSQDFISRAPPKNIDDLQQPQRSRFTILADISEVNSGLKKGEEPSLLANYLRDLHKMQTHTDRDKENERNGLNKSLPAEEDKPKRARLNPSLKLYTEKHEPVQGGKGSNIAYQKIMKFSRSGSSRDSSKLSIKQSDFNQSPAIFTYKMRIDLLQPIENWQEFEQNYTRQSERLPNKTFIETTSKPSEEMLFQQAIHQQSRHRPYR